MSSERFGLSIGALTRVMNDVASRDLYKVLKHGLLYKHSLHNSISLMEVYLLYPKAS